MADASHVPFCAQANALLRKNLTFQKRNPCANIGLICFPIILCLLLVSIQNIVGNAIDKGKQNECDPGKPNLDSGSKCPIPSPQEWQPLLQIPAPDYRAVTTKSIPFTDLPNESCKRTRSCPVTILFTGNNQSLGEVLAGQMFTNSFNGNSSDPTASFPDNVMGTEVAPGMDNFLDPAFFGHPIYHLQHQCSPNSSLSVLSSANNLESKCVQVLNLWRNSSSNVNDELYKGYQKGNPDGKINEILAAYDFLNSNKNNFNVSIWYNSTNKNGTDSDIPALVRVSRLVNLASNAYLKLLQGAGTKILFDFVKEMPRPVTPEAEIDISSVIGTTFYVWVILLLFPVVLTLLVYEKQQKLRIMMKLHGLRDGPYWMITYAYFLSISSIYMLCFVVFGSVIGLKFFSQNDYNIQFVFYFIYINLQISMAFLVATMFSNVKTASVVSYLCVFVTGLLASFFFQPFVEDASVPRGWIIVMELYPGFSLYRGIYEFSQYAYNGMQWGDLSDSGNGMKEVMIIMFFAWLVVLFIAYYVDHVSTGSGNSPLSFLQNCRKKPLQSFNEPSLHRHGSKTFVQMERPDVSKEREKVEQLLGELSASDHAIICDDLKKVYPGKDGSPKKFAVRGLSLALPRAECFGMLGPNGAGKTSFINMMIGLTKPTSGKAFVRGLDLRTQMDAISTSMGVCPQHDLLWESLTGREHLLFYGRLKNLKGSSLTQAVEESLKSVNLFNGGVADKQVGKYSGGMKRRLSVAISLIGNPKVVYMDEPSTGLDPASRNSLWNVVKRAKQDTTIILTTHSMEEAEFLCDRLGIVVDGRLQCIGNPKELKARYGGSYVLTMTTSSNHEEEVEKLVRSLSPGASKIYQISGTQKFELPKLEVRIADVFQAVENAKSRFTVFAWGLADTTLEDVFIKVACVAEAFNV